MNAAQVYSLDNKKDFPIIVKDNRYEKEYEGILRYHWGVECWMFFFNNGISKHDTPIWFNIVKNEKLNDWSKNWSKNYSFELK